MLGLNNKSNFISVFIHQPEDKIWVSIGVFLQTAPYFKLGIDNQTNIISIEFTMTEKLTKLMDQPNAHCGTYDDEMNGFNTCCQKYIETKMRMSTTCTVPGSENIIASSYK